MTRHGDGPPGGPLFAGPADDPDRYELTGPGIGGGEGVTWGARYQGRLRTPLRLAVKMLRRPPSAGADWPTAEDRQRWRDQAALLRHVRSAHLVTLHDVFTGPPPHGAGAADPTQTDVTPPYTAPEVLQAPRDPRDACADVYSLGALAYFCLTGTDPPVAGFGDAVGAEAVAAVRAAGVRNAEAVVRHLASALAADPAQRPTDVR